MIIFMKPTMKEPYRHISENRSSRTAITLGYSDHNPELFGAPWKGAIPQRVSRPARQLSLQPVAIRAVEGGNDFG